MLRLEPLEDRRLLAVLDLSIRFLQDIPQSDGSFLPGAELSSSTVRVEDPSAFFPYSFWVEVQVRDARTPPDTGVISLPLNVIWEPGDPQTPADAVQYSGELPVAGPNPTSFSVQQDNLLLTPDFTLQRFVDNLGLDGEFLNLRGAALPNAGTGAAIGAGEFEPFSQMRFTVNEFGRTCFRSELAGSMSFADAAVLEEVNSEGACIEFLPTGISLSGFVYADVDKDGQRDVSNTGVPVEQGLPNVEIQLIRDGRVVQTDFTGPDGWYHFEDFLPGTYGIREAAQPACFIDGTETLGIVLPSGESRGTAGDDRFSGIVLNRGDHGIDYNFGELGLKASCINKTMLLGSSNLRQATIYEPLGIQSTVVSGTAGPDQINVRVEDDRIAATVNGATTTIPRPASQPIVVTVDAQAGVDTVSFQGTDDTEVAHVQPSYAAARNEGGDDDSAWDWAVEFLSAENLSAAGAAGDDLTVIRDSTGNDLLTANGDSATLDWLTDQEVSLLAFERVRAIATRGGADKADVTDPLDFNLELLGNWTRV